MNKKTLIEWDKNYIWHPFTQMKYWLQEEPTIIIEGKDCFIKDIDGKWYLDGVSSLWVNIHGHRRTEIDEAVKVQLDKIAHSTLLGLSNEPSIVLAKKLAELLENALPWGEPLKKIFYSDNGSTAVEIALKIAYQYWVNLGVKGKDTFVSLKEGYHGDTIGAVSVGGVELFHQVYKPLLNKSIQAPAPYCYRCELGLSYPDCGLGCLKEMEKILKENQNNIIAVIVEPLVQCAGGIIVWPQGYLKGLRELCNKYEILLIADEVATGFGRTGKMFACEHEEVTPDIICLSKGITNGYMPLAVTAVKEKIFDAFLGEIEEIKTFYHGHSYTGNPLACAAAIANLEIFEKDKTLESLPPKIELLREELSEIGKLEHVGDVRQKGMIAGVELVKDKTTKEPFPWKEQTGWKVVKAARKHGVWLRPLGDIIVIIPPLIISEENLKGLLKVIKDCIIEITL
ncbi:adenosylmethionine--8-amino-7-oxononanoate transaminase [Thermodesulfovibrio sp. 1176]|uniref:adenosylmethionine--8-amino-7-oxononanoate transaminase n=1 Tax=Thermodesulfovibrio sp. 1176 TaxID=3043424 RepID=UPI0024827167|nr:adenosylmethionine--8-amino-7-oxononanoate transaminase [Thermodesulfovibrio sp. 1176]MDI1471960.1 adenosylmethionine--8-amino-7-oxononanoate transaminase [Thermodesulfovibrio sp. 1176]